MALPTNREQFRDSCLRQLGWPVIEINVDDDQVEDCIDMALQYFQDFHYDGTQLWYMKHQLTQQNIDDRFIVIPDEIIGVTKIFSPGSASSGFNMFDFQYQWRLNDMATFTTPLLTHYVQIQQHLSMIDMLLVGENPIRFNRHTNKLYLDWDWNTDASVGRWLIIQGYVVLDPNEYNKVWSDRMLKRLAVAYIKRVWGRNMSKFIGMKLPGGIEMNGQKIYDEAVQEIQEVEQLIRDTYELPPSFLVG